MQRRTVLKSALAGAAALAAPGIVRAESQRVLKFIPQADLAFVDPVVTTADVTRNHAHLVFDTLYGIDEQFAAHPQMVEGHVVSDDGKQWDLTLREGLKFHDGTPVLARDAVASLQRWAKRDSFGSVLMVATDELSAVSDKVIRFRLNKKFPLLPNALAVPSNMPCIVPERIAQTSPTQAFTEVVGSGPFRFLPDERVAGARVAYEKFAGYVPRASGTPSYSAGPKIVHFDRVEWTVVPDAATAAAAMMSDEYDWWEQPIIDLVPSLKKNRKLTVAVKDLTGEVGCLRFNHLNPPFDNPAIRRVVISAIDQREFMEAVAGAEPSLIKTGIGVFVPGAPMASDVGLDTMKGPKDIEKLKRDLTAAGYKGERVVLLAASNYPTINAIAQVGGDLLKRIGFNVDYQSLDWGTVVQRRASKEPIDKGGWNIFFTFLGGTGNVLLPSHLGIRASGGDAWFGWPKSEKLEALRQSWFDAPDLEAQKKICRDLQMQFWQDVPYCPLGMYDQPTAFRTDLVDVRVGIPQFYGVRRV